MYMDDKNLMRDNHDNTVKIKNPSFTTDNKNDAISKFVRCPACGKALRYNYKFCPEDGTRIPEELRSLLPGVDEDQVDIQVGEDVKSVRVKTLRLNIYMKVAVAFLLCLSIWGAYTFVRKSNTTGSAEDALFYNKTSQFTGVIIDSQKSPVKEGTLEDGRVDAIDITTDESADTNKKNISRIEERVIVDSNKEKSSDKFASDQSQDIAERNGNNAEASLDVNQKPTSTPEPTPRPEPTPKPTPTPIPEPIVIPVTQSLARGDVNADGIVDERDVLLVRQFIAGAAFPTDAEFARADLSGDGQLKSNDVLLLRQIIGE